MRRAALLLAVLLTFGSAPARAASIVIGFDAGSTPLVSVIDPLTHTTQTSFDAYASAFAGGVRVAVGDVNGDGVTDIITGAGPGGAPHVKVFDGATGNAILSFFAFDPGFTGGVYVAAGDVTGDGAADIIVGGDAGGGPQVKVFDGASGVALKSFFAFDAQFRGGVRVAAGDVNGDGLADIVVGAGPGGGPHVKVFDGLTLAELQSFFAFEPQFGGGVYVATGDVNGDGKADVVVGAGPGRAPEVHEYDAVTGAPIRSFFAFYGGADGTYTGGVRVAMADLYGDGWPEAIVATGPGVATHINIFDGAINHLVGSFFVNGFDFTDGVFVAASPLKPFEATLGAATADNFRQGIPLLQNGMRSLRNGNTIAACNMLKAFTNQVDAQTGKALTPDQAGQLLFLAADDRRLIGCR